jgi:hypothetical protein
MAEGLLEAVDMTQGFIWGILREVAWLHASHQQEK